MKALSENGGDFALTAKAIGTSYANVYQRVHRSEELKRHVTEVEQMIIGAAKGVLMEAIVKKKSERWAAWWLERKDRNSFSTRSELTGPNGSPIPVAQKVEVTVTYVDAPATEPEENEPPI